MIALYTMDEAAKELRVSRRWLQEFIQRHPYYRTVGRKKLFTAEDLARLIGALPCPGSSSRPAKARRRTGTSVANTSASLWTTARALLRNERRGASSRRGESRQNVVNFANARAASPCRRPF
jgi:excisionase family DNA binding protein